MTDFRTEPKTMMIYSSDNDKLKELGISPKNIMRLGLQAYDSGWSLAKETTQIDDLKSRISFMSKTLQMYIDKLNLVTKIINKKHGNGLNVDDLTTKDLQNMLEELQ